MSETNLFACTLTVTDDLLDAPYHHVHHATTLRFLETGRLRFLEAIGYPIEWFFERNMLLVITDISIRYVREIRAGKIEVRCESPRIEERKIVIHQKLINERGKLAVEATVSSMSMNSVSRRGVYPPEEFVRRFAL